ncbi:MAG TPA: polysaccharide deacetylase family protein [Planctomycetota bacterium]|nr:polysaccharide deacetylase family protein [Planctomycetota bacterium]
MTLPVYYYHRVGPFRDGAPPKLNVDPAAFREHMSVLAHRANAVSIVELVACAREGRPIPRGAVAVTFDDGYRDLMEFALPVLKEFRIPAAFFMVTGGIGATDAWNKIEGVPNEPIMSWDDLKRLRDEGMTIGSHSATHEVLDGLPESRLREEVEGSRRLLQERLGVPVRHFAYPQGRFSPAAEAAVKAGGYDAGWATRKGRPLAPGDVTAIRRAPVSSFIRGGRFRWELLLMKMGIR